MKALKNIVVGVVAGFTLVAIPALVYAQPANPGSGQTPANPGYSQTPANPGSGSAMFVLQNPLNFETICGFMKGVFSAIITIGIPVAVLFIVWAGFRFVWARGRPDALQEAKRNALYVLLGIAVFLGAWFLSQIIAATIHALGGPSITSCR